MVWEEKENGDFLRCFSAFILRRKLPALVSAPDVTGLRFTAASRSDQAADGVMDCLPPSPPGLPIEPKVYSNSSEGLRELENIPNLFQTQVYRRKAPAVISLLIDFFSLGKTPHISKSIGISKRLSIQYYHSNEDEFIFHFYRFFWMQFCFQWKPIARNVTN